MTWPEAFAGVGITACLVILACFFVSRLVAEGVEK